eukprot:354639-Chlamydomonas_euryale.AAC.3
MNTKPEISSRHHDAAHRRKGVLVIALVIRLLGLLPHRLTVFACTTGPSAERWPFQRTWQELGSRARTGICPKGRYPPGCR